MTNKTPTTPGWWYANVYGNFRIVEINENMRVECFGEEWPVDWMTPADKPAFEWLGPVPMPGEWAPMEMFNQLWTALAAKTIGRGSADYQLLQRARAWDDPEETP